MTPVLPAKQSTIVNGHRLAHVEMGQGEPIDSKQHPRGAINTWPTSLSRCSGNTLRRKLLGTLLRRDAGGLQVHAA